MEGWGGVVGAVGRSQDQRHLEAKVGTASIRQGTRGSAGEGVRVQLGAEGCPEGEAEPANSRGEDPGLQAPSVEFGNLAMGAGAGRGQVSL